MVQLKRYILWSVLFLFTVVVKAQDNGIQFNINVKHKGRACAECLVKIFRNDSFFDQVKVTETGEFDHLLAYDYVYLLKFTGEGLATKVLELDLISNIPEDEKSITHQWSIGEISLHKAYKEIDLSVLETPVARIHYETDLAEFSIDYKYTSKRKKELSKLEGEVEELEKNDFLVEKQNEQRYKNLLAEADKMVELKNYELAKEKYAAASELYPNQLATRKLEKLNQILKREEQYSSLLASAKKMEEEGLFQAAMDKLKQASTLKPTASIPKQRMESIAQKIKFEQQQANTFNNYIKVADEAFANGNYEIAYANYDKALDLNPDAILAKKKLEQSAIKVKEVEAQEQLDEEFASLLFDLKNAIYQNDRSLAQELLQKATTLKPNSTELEVERKRVEALVKKENDRALLAEQEAKKKEEDYRKYIELGKNSKAKGNIKEAKFFFNKALALKEDDTYVRQELAAMEKMPEQEKVVVEDRNAEFADHSDLNKMDKKSEAYHTELAKRYPQGATTRSYKEGNKNITKTIIVKGEIGTEYTRIQYSWGGVYYFRNGEAISKILWEKDTKQ